MRDFQLWSLWFERCGDSAELDWGRGRTGSAFCAQAFDLMTEAGVEVFGLADGQARSWNWLADVHGDFAGIEVAGVHGEEVVDAAEGDWDDGDLGANGEEGGSGKERLHVSVRGAGALGEDEEGHAGAEGADAGTETGDGRVGIDGVDGDLTGAVEVPADEGHGPELLLGQDTELEGERGEDDRRIHIGGMVGGVDGDRVLTEIFCSANGEARAGDFDAAARPDLGQAMLHTSAFIPDGGKEREASADSRVDEKERGLEDVRAPTVKPGQRVRRSLAVHGIWPTRSGG